eukprot:366366-Chlamydomonas_euryale.AAC.17
MGEVEGQMRQPEWCYSCALMQSTGSRVLSRVPGSYRHPCSRRYALRSIRCGRNLLRSLLRIQHLHAYSDRRVPSHVPPTYLSGALWPPDVLAQPLGVAGSQDPWWVCCYTTRPHRTLRLRHRFVFAKNVLSHAELVPEHWCVNISPQRLAYCAVWIRASAHRGGAIRRGGTMQCFKLVEMASRACEDMDSDVADVHNHPVHSPAPDNLGPWWRTELQCVCCDTHHPVPLVRQRRPVRLQKVTRLRPHSLSTRVRMAL